MHGLQPGPMLFQENPDVVWAVIASMFIGNTLLLFMNLPMAGFWAKLTHVPNRIMFPIIIVLCLVGTYSINNSVMDVVMTFLFGILGYLMKKGDFPIAPIILTFVLGDIMESTLVQSMTMFRGDAAQFVQRPICAVMLLITAAVLVVSILTTAKRRATYGDEEIEM